MKVKKLCLPVLVMGAVFAFSGCTPKEELSPNGSAPTPPSVSVPDEPSKNGDRKTFENFSADAEKSAQTVELAKSLALGGEEPLSCKIFVCGSQYKLNSVIIYATVKESGTGRALKKFVVSPRADLYFDDILGGNLPQSEGFSLSSDIIFGFDAEQNFIKQDLANALFEAAGAGSQSVKLFNLVNDEENIKDYQILVESEHGWTVNQISVEVQENGDEAVIESLANPLNYELTEISSETQPGGEYTFKASDKSYTLEKFEESDLPPAPPVEQDSYVGTFENLIDKHFEEMENFLNESYYQKFVDAIKKNNLLVTDESKFEGKEWSFGVDENNNINKINFTTYYNRSNTSKLILVYSATLDNAINLETVKDNELLNTFEQASSKFKQEYSIPINPTIQEEKKELTDAIFEKVGVEDTGARRYIVDKGHTISDSTLKESNEFQVVEVNNLKIVEYYVRIKDASTDKGFIEQLNNGNYREYVEMKEYEIGGKPFVKTGGAE